METIWLENWSDVDGLKENFEIRDSELEGVNILLAYYGYESYESDAFVLFEKGGELFEVNGGHCSCYGLEDQWKPEKTTVKDLLFRLNEGTKYRQDRYDTELRKVLERIGQGETDDR